MRGISDLNKSLAEPVAHLVEGLAELLGVDEAAPVPVDALEQPLPLVDVLEERPELCQVDLAALVLVEHVDHHPARLLGEVRPVSIHQGLLELLGVNLGRR